MNSQNQTLIVTRSASKGIDAYKYRVTERNLRKTKLMINERVFLRSLSPSVATSTCQDPSPNSIKHKDIQGVHKRLGQKIKINNFLTVQDILIL